MKRASLANNKRLGFFASSPSRNYNFLTASDAHALQAEYQRPLAKLAVKVLRHVESTIRAVSSTDGQDVLIDLDEFEGCGCDLLAAIMSHFRQQGFYVKHARDAVVYISWRVA